MMGILAAPVGVRGLPSGPTSCFTLQGHCGSCSSNVVEPPKEDQGMMVKWVRWTAPEPYWFKLNTDGAAKGCPGCAGAGGLIRDSSGRWVVGFSYSIGVTKALDAELRAIAIGLALAWDTGVRRLVLESDSEIAIRMITDPRQRRSPHTRMLDLIWGVLDQEWEVRIQHVYREGNSSADWLANNSLQFEFGTMVSFVQPPLEMGEVLVSDMMGTYTPGFEEDEVDPRISI